MSKMEKNELISESIELMKYVNQNTPVVGKELDPIWEELDKIRNILAKLKEKVGRLKTEVGFLSIDLNSCEDIKKIREFRRKFNTY